MRDNLKRLNETIPARQKVATETDILNDYNYLKQKAK
jgi:hypothetical protein